MVSFNKFTLTNGLRLLVHEDHNTPMAVVNVLYDVGARDEDPEQTGFAHLFEHLMFSGSVNIPSYDGVLQRVGGENNAFTSNDITNYYLSLPAVNLETALWLESDRMLGLAFDEKGLEVQRNVVCEEFKQRYLNQPYGDVWLRLRPMAYQTHPYRWATIGKELSHIENARMDDVRHFFKKHYNPSNAILVIAGDVVAADVVQLAEKWFGGIPSGVPYLRALPQESPQLEARRDVVEADVPLNSIYIAFHGPSRLDSNYHAADLLTDLLGGGQSARLYRSLVKEHELFSQIGAYSTDSIDSSLLVIEGRPLPHVSIEEAERSIWRELDNIKTSLVPQAELDKVKNRTESNFEFSRMSILNKAMNLAYYELLGNADEYNRDVAKYAEIKREQVQRVAQSVLRHENSNTLIYLAKPNDD